MEPRLFLVFEKDKALHLHLGGYFDNLELQQNFTEAVEFLKAKGLSKMLVDLSKLSNLKDVDQIWLKETWYPGAIAGGLKHVSFVVPADFIKKHSLSEQNHGEIEGLDYGFFKSQSEAVKELSSFN